MRTCRRTPRSRAQQLVVGGWRPTLADGNRRATPTSRRAAAHHRTCTYRGARQTSRLASAVRLGRMRRSRSRGKPRRVRARCNVAGAFDGSAGGERPASALPGAVRTWRRRTCDRLGSALACGGLRGVRRLSSPTTELASGHVETAAIPMPQLAWTRSTPGSHRIRRRQASCMFRRLQLPRPAFGSPGSAQNR